MIPKTFFGLPKTGLPYPFLLVLAAFGLLILQIQVDPNLVSILLTRDLDMVSHQWSMAMAGIGLGLIAVRLAGKTLWPTPSIYVFLLIAAALMHSNRIAAHLLEYGILALLMLLAALLSVDGSINLLVALLLARNFAIWRYETIFPLVPHHAVLFYCTANFIFFTAVLQGVGIMLGLVFNFWPQRFLRVSGATMITAGLLTYFYSDMAEFAHNMLY